MAVFRYKAIAADGAFTKGEIEAASEASAVEKLISLGVHPVEATATKSKTATTPARVLGGTSFWFRTGSRISPREKAEMAAQLAQLLSAGLPLGRAIEIAGDSAASPALAQLYQRLLDALREGTSLADALDQEPEAADAFFVGVVRAGESSGRLAEAMGSLALNLKRLQNLRQKAISALVYPAVLVTVSILSIGLILTLVVPQFEALFASSGAALPLSTRIVLATSSGLSTYGPAAFAFLVIALAALILLRKKPEWLIKLDGTLLGVPIFGDIIRQINIARFCRTLGLMLANKVALLPALKISTQTVENAYLAHRLAAIELDVRAGTKVSEAISAAGIVPPFVQGMLTTGEESGGLGHMALEAADILDERVGLKLQTAVSLLQPAIILFLGVLIGGIVFSIFAAIFSVNELAF